MPRVKIIRSAREMGTVRSLWESLSRKADSTIFQDYLWNLLALSAFSTREVPWLVCVEASYGAAIVPAVVRRKKQNLGLLGEELFDYRTFLHQGDEEVLRLALGELGRLTLPLEIVAVRERDCSAACEAMAAERFSAAPAIYRSDITAEQFAGAHSRLGRNLRRLKRLGFALKLHDGRNRKLLRSIYQLKADQDPESLFRDFLRIDFLANAAAVQPESFEMFTLESGSHLCAALITLRDRNFRRFYTGWFDAGLQKHSPAMTLIHEVTRRSLEQGLDCDFMTGEQPYKLRLATRSEPLYRVRASSHQLAAMSHCYQRLSA